jgi:hypothetical protein
MNREDLVTKKPILATSGPVHRDDPRKSGEIEMKVDGANIAPSAPKGFDDMGPYVDPKSSRPGKPNIVDAEIKPLKRQANTTIVAYLRGGFFDGVEVDVPAMQMVHQAVVETPPEELTQFEFDGDAHALWVRTGGLEGKPNIIKGTHDTVTYKRTSERTEDGAIVFQAVA